MTADRDARLRELFLVALEQGPARRSALLNEWRESYPELYPELVALLAHDDATSGRFLNTPLLGLPRAGDEASLVGRSIGPYRIEEHLATGGMGSVYRAVRVDPYRQAVAIKLIRPDLLAGPAARRFLQERQVLASLNHPHIARLLDGGTTEEGWPYLVMEHIAGRPITRYCEEKRLSVRQRLELFRLVCLAVHHAHQRLVIHRDLKPSNVLVTEAGEPKVLDFGLARALAPEGESAAPDTRAGQLLGTPAYMSPEQADAGAAGHDIRTDVYALGVIGYELLAGRLPYDVSGRPLLQQLEMVRLQEPVPLSRVNPACRGDVATIFARALEKEPDRRYPSAAELAGDVERCLRHEPIQARPPRLAYLVGKFVRRHRALVTGTLAALLALVVGVVATGLALRQARAERDAKEELLVQSHVHLARLQTQRGEWTEALANYDRALAGGHPEEARLRLERAKVLGVLHRVAEADQELQGLTRREEVPAVRAAALLWLGDLRLGLHSEEAIPLIRQAQELGLDDPTDQAYAAGLLAESTEESLQHFRRALEIDPSHRRANEMLFLTLVSLGRRTEAAERLAILKAAYPEDLTTHIGSALLAVHSSDAAEVNRHLDACQGLIGNEDREAMRWALGIWRRFRDVDEVMRGTGLTMQLVGMIMRIASEGRRISAHRRADGAPGGLALPPALRSSVGRLLDAHLLFNKARLREALAEATRAHPEGTLFFLLGRLHSDFQDYEAARAALEQALQTPAILEARKAALGSLLEVEYRLSKPGGPGANPRAALTLARVRTYMAEGGVRGDNGVHLAVLAHNLGDRELALWIATETVRQSPRDPVTHGALGLIEHVGGNHARALTHFDRALALRPRDEDFRKRIERLTEEARQKLQSQNPHSGPKSR